MKNDYPPSTDRFDLYPISLRLEGRRVLIVGAGAVATRKAERLIGAGALVAALAPEISDRLKGLARAGALELIEEPFRPERLDGAFLVFAATDDRALNRAIYDAAHERGALVNIIDDPLRSDFHLPALFQRGELTVTFSTGGASPALAKSLREKFEAEFGPIWDRRVRLLKAVRARALESITDRADRDKIFSERSMGKIFDLLANSERREYDIDEIIEKILRDDR